MWVWICGPYAGNGATPDQRAQNLKRLNLAALAVLTKGHVPIIGANLALPMIAAKGGDDAAHDIRLPLSLALIERCDACLRLDGPSIGSDAEVNMFREIGRPVYFAMDDLPDASQP